MAVKGRHNRRKSSHRKSTRKHGRRHCRAYRKRGTRCTRRLRGGNYETDVTTRETEGVPTKALNKFVVTMPGRVAMSGTSYKALMADIDAKGGDDV